MNMLMRKLEGRKEHIKKLVADAQLVLSRVDGWSSRRKRKYIGLVLTLHMKDGRTRASVK